MLNADVYVLLMAIVMSLIEFPLYTDRKLDQTTAEQNHSIIDYSTVCTVHRTWALMGATYYCL